MRHLWKGAFLGTAALALVAGSAVDALAVCTCEDVNESGGPVTIGDCVKTARIAAGLDPADATLRECADVTNDGGVTVSDVVYCLNRTLSIPPLFPPCAGPGPVINCPGGNATISADVTANQIWPSTCTVTLDGTVFVNGGVTLTIQPGTTIKGKKVSTDGSPSALIFRRDARIDAAGTQTNPIVFTSDQTAGSRNKGDWAGLMLNGRAPVNVPGGEGLAEGLSVPFGGNNPNDSSGVVTYVRIEFAGKEISTDNELNLFTMNSVGAGTTIDFVQAHVGEDDAHEWFGGTVRSKHLVASAQGDDGLDWQLGFTGAVQYALVAQYEPFVESGGSMGFEGDNNENGFDLTPRSNPKFCNVTAIGPRGQAVTNAVNNGNGVLLRRGTAGQFANLLVTKFRNAGVELRDGATSAVACNGPDGNESLTGNTSMRNSRFFDNGATGDVQCFAGSATPCNTCELYDLWANTLGVQPDLCSNAAPPWGCADTPSAGTDPLLATYNWPPNPVPALASSLGTGAFATCSSIDPSFDDTSYIGGFQPGAASWLTSPWISFAIN